MVRTSLALLSLLGLAYAGPASSSSDRLAQCAAGLDGKVPSTAPPSFHFSGNVRRYYIAAEEVDWNYVPSGWDNWLGVPIGKSPRAKAASVNTYGSTWRKALYRGYTDSTFMTKSEQPAYQGIQGPTIRAEVGDIIEIMFINDLPLHYASIHSMGLAYSKYSEGADYANNTMPGQNVTEPESAAVPPVGSGVAPGGCVIEKWLVNDIAGPNNGEPAKTHSYHSYVSMQEDTNAGLIGPTIIYAKNQMAKTMSEYREFPLLYMVYSEATSFLSGQNAMTLSNATNVTTSVGNVYPGGNQSVWYPQLVNFDGGNQFSAAPSFYTMNGYIFSNVLFPMCEGDKAIWYVNGYGQASHVFHMHGSGFSYKGGETGYSMSVNDGNGHTLYMNAEAVGKWQVICHVNNHHALGMVADYQIYPKGQCPLPSLGSSYSSRPSSSQWNATASGGFNLTRPYYYGKQ